LSGYWKQLNHTFPLSLKRTAEADQVEGTLAENEYAPKADSDLQGFWSGALDVGAAQLHLNLRIAEPTPGTFHAQVDSVDQGAQNLPIPTMTYSKPAVRFEMPGINGSFEGTVNGRDDEIAGTWTQMGKKFPLTFARAAQTAPASAATEKDYGQGAPNQVQGHWKGAVDVNHIALHIVFHVALMSDGAYSATMDSPDQGARSIPATSAAFNYPDLKMEWKGSLPENWRRDGSSAPGARARYRSLSSSTASRHNEIRLLRVVAGFLPAVEPGIQPGGKTARRQPGSLRMDSQVHGKPSFKISNALGP
jgi:hypothetical protein